MADRKATLEAIVPPNGDGVLRILILKPGTAAGSQISTSCRWVGGRAASEQLLVRDANPQDDFGCIDMVAPCSEIAPDGTLVVYTKSNGAVRVNPFTGAQSALPSLLGPVSASGQRSFMANPGGGGTLYEPDGSTVAIDLLPPPSGGLGYYTNYGSPYAFFGEDFYYVSSQAALIRLPPSGAPEQIATGIAGFRGAPDARWTPADLGQGDVRSERPGALHSRSAHRRGDGLAVQLHRLQHLARRAVVAPRRHIFDSSFTFFNSHSDTQQVVEVPGIGPLSVLPGGVATREPPRSGSRTVRTRRRLSGW